MVKIALKENEYRMIPEGEVIVRIKSVDDSEFESFDKLSITIEDSTGATAKVNFNFVNQNGEPNTTAEQIYARLCRTFMGNQTLDNVDTDELVGKYALVLIEYSTSNRGSTFANVKRYISSADGFEKSAAASDDKVAALKAKLAAARK